MTKRKKTNTTQQGLKFERVSNANRCMGCKAAYNHSLCKELPFCSIIENNIHYPIVWK